MLHAFVNVLLSNMYRVPVCVFVWMFSGSLTLACVVSAVTRLLEIHNTNVAVGAAVARGADFVEPTPVASV
jgi:hypothetical protein